MSMQICKEETLLNMLMSFEIFAIVRHTFLGNMSVGHFVTDTLGFLSECITMIGIMDSGTYLEITFT